MLLQINNLDARQNLTQYLKSMLQFFLKVLKRKNHQTSKIKVSVGNLSKLTQLIRLIILWLQTQLDKVKVHRIKRKLESHQTYLVLEDHLNLLLKLQILVEKILLSKKISRHQNHLLIIEPKVYIVGISLWIIQLRKLEIKILKVINNNISSVFKILNHKKIISNNHIRHR